MIADFRIEGLLGEGGMGRVYLGRSPGGRRVAVKVIRSEYAADPIFRKRFAREISAMKRVPGIFTAPVMNADAEGSPPWLATTYVEGVSLQDRVRSDGPLPSRGVLELAISLAEALSAIHAEGLTHRDLKPSNVLLAGDGPKVIDFGLAVTSDATLLTGTRPIGTPAYMSPEQCRGGRVEQPSDVFSLGGLLVYAATGQGPFGTGTAHELVYRVVHGEPQLGVLDGPLREIVGECLRRDPAARPTPAGLLARLTAIAESGADASEATADMSGRTTTADSPPRTRVYTHPFGASAASPPRRGESSRAVGIDLGTHKSVVCVLEGGKPTVIADAQGLRRTPTVVARAPGGALLVGRSAQHQEVLHPDRAIRSVGRRMGTGWRKRIDGEDFVPQQIIGFVLRKLKRDAEAHIGEPVTEAVISGPVHFSENQRQAVREAAQIAGLNVLRLIAAPSLAASAYATKRLEEVTLLLFDLGGGTLDVSLVEVGYGVVAVKAASGDSHLGGDDWDARIVDWLLERFSNANGVDLSTDEGALQRIREAAEKAKIALSYSSETRISVPYITRTAAGLLDLDDKLTRDEFQRMTSDLLHRARTPVRRVLGDAGIGVSDIDQVVLVGGATRMPAVSDMVKELTGKEPGKSVDPDEGVAIGAGLYAGVLTGEVKDFLLLDVTPLSLGVETLGGVFHKIIERNTEIPIRRDETFTIGVAPSRQDRDDDDPGGDSPPAAAALPTQDGQPGVAEINIYQGEREIAADNNKLGTIRLSDLPAGPLGVPRIEVGFDIDANGLFTVSAKDLVTGNKRTVTITVDSALPQEDIHRMKREAEELSHVTGTP